MPKKTIADIEVTGQRVLMRVDFNVPLDADGVIIDDRRIRLALPSIRSVLERGGRLVLMSHLGRPGGEGYEAKYSLKPAADRLAELLPGVAVTLAGQDGVREATAVAQLGDGEVVVLENLRFHAGEKEGDASFATRLASYGDIYCNEAFGTAHRSHASMVGVPEAMPGRPHVAGLLLAKELKYLGEVLRQPQRPFVAVLGGAKVSDKLGAIRNLIGTVDTILIGGAMAYTLLKAQGHRVGASLVEDDMKDEVRAILTEASAGGTEIMPPQDHVCAQAISRDSPVEITEGPDIGDDWLGLDIGPATRDRFRDHLLKARTIVWNGPMGVFETPPFDVGTRQVGQAIVDATASGAISVIGGGETAAAAETMGFVPQVTHVSTGGGASLHMLEGRAFASVDLLDDAG